MFDSFWLKVLQRPCCTGHGFAHDSLPYVCLAEGSSLFDVTSGKGFMESLPSLASCFHEDQPADRPPSEELLSMEEGGLQGFIPWGELLAVSEEDAAGPEQNRLEEASAEQEEQSKEGEGQLWGLWGPEPDPDGLNSKEV